MAAPSKQYPKDGLVIVSMMKDMGITNFEPRVVNQLMEFAIRYVSCVLEDAKVFANHAKKKSIDNDDVKLAVMMQMDKVFTTPPPRDLLLEVARTKNSTALPLVKSHCGFRLPPDRYCFSSCNFKLKFSKKPEVNKRNYSIGGNSSLSSPLESGKNSSGMTTSTPKRTLNVPSVARTPGSKPVIKVTTSPMVVGQAQQVMNAKAKNQSGIQQIEVKTESGDNSNNGFKRKREDDDM